MRTIRLFNHHVHTVYYLLAMIEGLLFFGAFYFGAQLYFLQEQEPMGEHITSILPRALVFAVVSMASMVAVGLYKPQLRERSSGVLLRLMSAFVLTILGMSLVFYLLPNLHLWRGVFAQSLLVAFVFCLFSRAIFSRLVDIEQLKSRVLVLGTGWRANTALGWLRRDSDRRSFRFVGFVRSNGEPVQVEGQNVVESPPSLQELVTTMDVDQIVVALDDRRKALPIDELAQCRLSGIEVLDVATFFEREAGKIMLDFVSPSWLVFSDGFKHSTWRQISKRLFDIGASLMLLMIVWPIMMLTLLAIWIEDGFGTPAIYRQQRVGLHGKVFDLLKLRSMRVDAEGDGKARWADKNDCRITRVGAIIRRLRIDELPQILNILRGDMSLVGPRPERPTFVEELQRNIPFYSARHQVKPGIAGWAQLHYPYGASEEDARQKLQYELYYVKNHNVFLDFMIILSTTEVVLFGEGVR
ncbi:TIGR03013 family XrtA/PEP-CTERM system glycosyltransferase [Parahaliea aestuarii]|uniref:TIGR03013 family PEP-CTERM/XrtA system glycosyltransferase n=1 Tax=Parahaliea aestuarii TaxID=1852021 RepID=A0A5C8ZPC8_9GAMM|nr:TIGR03013 family XrtA/PEP-CTERM system glycosyltransferase [Parahaliea aestuarii]TXS89624.1 TIGR03013 family PEP-CTERM/XrtA system glycosyltransferase [Parahaliea aestuarii]